MRDLKQQEETKKMESMEEEELTKWFLSQKMT